MILNELILEKLPSIKDNNELILKLEYLLACLEDKHTSRHAIVFLHKFYKEVSSLKNSKINLYTHEFSIDNDNTSIKLFLNDAVFVPENWGQTFAQGLLRKAKSFENKNIAELGTGSGWISFLLLLKTKINSIEAFDINPIAVLIANLNLWLNGTRANGDLIIRDNSIPFHECFKAHKSDLLEYSIRNKHKYDYVIGCIPQVIHPELDNFKDENTTFQELKDLSNYCFKQGINEDFFGLPLMAKAIEQSQIVLNKDGKVIFVMGGRPGVQIIEQLFEKRGFIPSKIYGSRILQADDTSLDNLVEVERIQNISFHFFLNKESTKSINASTAKLVQSKNKPIFHDLYVYEAKLQHKNEILNLIQLLNSLGLNEYRQEYDFTNVNEESVKFCIHFLQTLKLISKIPYPPEEGSYNLRNKISEFLQICCNLTQDPKYLFIAPTRANIISILIKFLSGKNSSILVSNNLYDVYHNLFLTQKINSIKTNDVLIEIFSIFDTVNPDIVLIAPEDFKNPNMFSLNYLIDKARANPDKLFIIDESDNFQIDTNLNCNILLKLIANVELPSNLIFIYGFIKSVMGNDFELSFILNTPYNWLKMLEIGGELTYSRISYITQLYYEWLFQEVLNFPNFNKSNFIPKSGSSFKLDSNIYNLLNKSEVFQEKIVDTSKPELIRFDYGENELRPPNELINSIVLSLINHNNFNDIPKVQMAICDYIQFSRKVSVVPDNIALAQGVMPILGAIIQSLVKKFNRPITVGVPKGSYGVIYPLISYYDCNLKIIDTKLSNAFLCTVDDLKDCQIDLLWITQPSNPAGFYYNKDQIKNLVKFCYDNDIYILSDEIFYLLADLNDDILPDYELSFLNYIDDYSNIFVTDGLSKAFAAGGLRFGFVVSPNLDFVSTIQKFLDLPNQFTLNCAQNFYSLFNSLNPKLSNIENYIRSVQRILNDRRLRLLDMFENFDLNLKYNNPRGGLFLLAKLEKYRVELAKKHNLLLNSDKWSLSQDYSRISFSTTEIDFENGLNRLNDFLLNFNK